MRLSGKLWLRCSWSSLLLLLLLQAVVFALLLLSNSASAQSSESAAGPESEEQAHVGQATEVSNSASPQSNPYILLQLDNSTSIPSLGDLAGMSEDEKAKLSAAVTAAQEAGKAAKQATDALAALQAEVKTGKDEMSKLKDAAAKNASSAGAASASDNSTELPGAPPENAVDFSPSAYIEFVETKVRLYYYSNVAELMHTINSHSGLESYATDPARDPEQIRFRVKTAGQLLDEARRKLLQDVDIFNSIDGQLKAANAKKTTDTLSQAATQAELKRLSDKGVTNGKEVDDLTTKSQKDAETIKADEAAISELTPRLAGASALVETDRTAVENAAVEFKLAAELRTLAIRAQRDSPRLLMAFGNADCEVRDPFRRIFLYGFPDSNTIILRGPRKDVKQALDFIRLFDEPSPQARVTLWTLELNSKATPKGAKFMNAALAETEKEFSQCRMEIGGVLSILKAVIDDKVRTLDSTVDPDLGGRFTFYDQVVLDAFDPRLASNADTAEALDEPWNFERYLQDFLPDPANLPTLSQQLIALRLSRQETRNAVMDDLEFRLTNFLREDVHHGKRKVQPVYLARLRRALGADCHGSADLEPDTYVGDTALLESLESSQEVLLAPFKRYAVARMVSNIYEDFDKYEESLTSEVMLRFHQQEVRESFAESLEFDPYQESLEQALDAVKAPDDARHYHAPDQSMGWQEVPGKYETSRNACLVWSAGIARLTGSRSVGEYSQAIDKTLALINEGWTLSRHAVMNWNEQLTDDGGPIDKERRARMGLVYGDLLRLYRRDVGGRFSSISETDIIKADDLLKIYNQAMEDELDEYFVQPMLSRLRQRLQGKGVGLGVVQRTGMLTTNRMVARVDPRSSAALELGISEDYLDSAQALLNLYGMSKLKGAATGKLQDTINGFFDPVNTETYGLRSGSEFMITPIFDASGQGLSFMFDYDYANAISGPSGNAGSPGLPQIEHVGVNIEAQLSNFELRELTRYENNVSLGREAKKSGGLPFLKDLPLLRDVPFVGYFQKTKGRAAVTQQSLIFAQTSMYPTIVDIIRLFNNIDSGLLREFSDMGSETPDELIKLMESVYEEEG